jgi:type I restriction enzyme R subunit
MNVGQPERMTQNRVVALFRDQLKYDYLGNWEERSTNSCIEPELATAYLEKAGYGAAHIKRALERLRREAENPNRSLYDNNKAVYNLLRYGVAVQVAAGQNHETVQFINWNEPEKNDFALAEEVTLYGNRERRPDLVIYVNGIAVGVLELKRSTVSIGDGIRQNISNQRKEFNAQFFSTVQFVFAGNDTEGLRYGAIGTPEKYFLGWKEDEADNAGYKLDKYLAKMCRKGRLIELMRDFVLFDAGMKKLPRVHQYFGIKAAQAQVQERNGGIIWHTQGSGKSIVMVLLAKWILANKPNARVVVVTDRDELDKQIEDGFRDGGEQPLRTSSGADLMALLGQATPRLICSLVHKFGRRGVTDFDAFIQDLESRPSSTVGELFVFVDECHRTQSGKLHRTMKALMPNAVFIGFTGTPLLKADKKTSQEVFGGYIHTYKHNEAVDDGVVLDMVYEARDIEQELGSQEKVDAWFDAKTKGLNDWQKAALREKWGTMQQVLSSRGRMERVVADIVFDFATRPRLSDDRGTAILVANSMYEAARYYTLFQKSALAGKCAVVTSYDPQARDITLEDTGEATETDKEFLYRTYTELLHGVQAQPGKSKTETYEDQVKELFKTQPANMKLLIVVAKLLTGFDAPSCTYLYIDKAMQDHGLFQAICRTNRLDGEDKVNGFIIDYKDLFKNLVNEKGTGALQVYTSALDDSDTPGVEQEILMKDRLAKGKERLDNALEALAMHVEPVQPPKGDLEHIHYFCGNVEREADLKEREPLRAGLYKATAGLVRAYANIADELEAAGYSKAGIERIKKDLDRYLKLREVVRHAAGETIDLKSYEADMRHLLDTYIDASEPRKISPFDDMPLLELLARTGLDEVIAKLPEGIRSSKDAIAETIANNVRSKIIKDHLNDPAFYARMSTLLKEILADLRARRKEYAESLRRLVELAKRVQAGHAEDMPATLDTPGKRALYNNLPEVLAQVPPRLAADPAYPYGPNAKDHALALALRIDQAVKTKRPDAWRGVHAREQAVKQALHDVLGSEEAVERIFPIIKQQAEY